MAMMLDMADLMAMRARHRRADSRRQGGNCCDRDADDLVGTHGHFLLIEEDIIAEPL
jgi:hypothetical protein